MAQGDERLRQNLLCILGWSLGSRSIVGQDLGASLRSHARDSGKILTRSGSFWSYCDRTRRTSLTKQCLVFAFANLIQSGQLDLSTEAPSLEPGSKVTPMWEKSRETGEKFSMGSPHHE
ncbi:hypothetical protein R1flu_022469 [Riccia fluitans]|uniref:Uncharacterized protein n=1 Tax=Riccia fluitans TaxID=41844 RepID=A0ABD1XP93_9MARC